MDPATQPPPAPNPATPPSERRVFVHVALLATLLLFLGAVGLLYSGWLNNDEPESVLIFAGDKSLDGVVITVRRVDPRTNQLIGKALTTTFNEQNLFFPRFFVAPGIYDVHMTLGNDELLSQRVKMESNRGLQCRMSSLTDIREHKLQPASTTPRR